MIETVTSSPRLQQIPSMVNAHSHAFQRRLRGIGERQLSNTKDDFWSWREEMYRLSSELDPDSIYDSALETYREMRAAGYGIVAEFHYVHHQPSGKRYADANVMAKAVAQAAKDVGLLIVLLPTAYQRAGWSGKDIDPSSGQLRFCDRSVDDFLNRVEDLETWSQKVDGVWVGIAAHSVRAVSRPWLAEIARYSRAKGIVRHIHAHEQVRELTECHFEYGISPLELLAETGFLGEHCSVVHGTHVSDRDIDLLVSSGSSVVVCPTTEGNLGDGHFPAMRYLARGAKIAIGSDSNVIIDPFEEVRELETGARRESQSRATLLAQSNDLWTSLMRNGCRSIGIDEGSLPTTTIDLNHPKLRDVADEDLYRALATCASSSVVV